MAGNIKSVKTKMTGGRRKDWGILRLQGNLTLDCADQILRFFREGAQKYKHLQVEAESVVGLDLGFLQLLQALSEAQKVRDCELSVKLKLESDLELLLRNTGFAGWLDQRPAKGK